jgi:hypothetical protein
MMKCPLKGLKRKKKKPQWEQSCENGGRYWSDVSRSSKQRQVSPESGKERKGHLLEPSEGTWSCRHTNCRLQAF